MNFYANDFNKEPCSWTGANEVLQQPSCKPDSHIEGLLRDGETVLGYVANDVEAQMFIFLCAYCIAGGKLFAPFGIGTSVPVSLCCGFENKYTNDNRLKLIFGRDPFETSKERAAKNLLISYPQTVGRGSLHLNTRSGQDAFETSLSPELKVIIFVDLNGCYKFGKQDDFDEAEVPHFFAHLNAKGIAILAFIHQSRNPKHRLLDFNIPAQNIFHLAYDAGAPSEFGAGFNVSRSRYDENDPVPSKFQFWHKVVDGRLEFGWTCRQKAGAADVKQVEMLERQMKVDILLKQGMMQKDIAESLNVDAATISRDVAKLKATNKEDEPEKNPPGGDGAPSGDPSAISR